MKKMKDLIFEYEKDFDILLIYPKKQKKIYQTLPLGNILLDLSFSGEIIGIQIEEFKGVYLK